MFYGVCFVALSKPAKISGCRCHGILVVYLIIFFMGNVMFYLPCQPAKGFRAAGLIPNLTTNLIFTLAIACAASLVMSACQPTPDNSASTPAPITSKPDIIVAQTPASIPPAAVGLKKMDFPVYLAGIPDFLHPIIPSVPLTTKADAYSSRSQSSTDVSYFQETSPYEFQSSVYNIVFEDLKTKQTHRLFAQDNFIIKSVYYPFVNLDKTAKDTDSKDTDIIVNNNLLLGYFIYQVKEIPNDNDSKTNLDEQLSLYMSDADGKNVVKLTQKNEYLKSFKWIPALKRYYFATQADTNNDHIIDENDKYFNYFIDFNQTPVVTTAYDFSQPKN